MSNIYHNPKKDLFIILELQYHQLQSYILFWIWSSLLSQSSSRNDSPKQIASAAFSNSKSIFRYLFLLMAGSNSRQVTLSQSSSRHNPQSPLPLQSELHLGTIFLSTKNSSRKFPLLSFCYLPFPMVVGYWLSSAACYVALFL